MRRSRLAPRRVWIVWSAQVAALLTGLELWVVQGGARVSGTGAQPGGGGNHLGRCCPVQFRCGAGFMT